MSTRPSFCGTWPRNVLGVWTCIVLHSEPLINPSDSWAPNEHIVYDEKEEEDKVLELWLVVVKDRIWMDS